MIALTALATFVAAVPLHEETWISAFVDWPRRGVRYNDFAVIAAEITVDTRGYPSDCGARATAGNPNMAKYTCDLIKKRARFRPARDASGQKIYGVHRTHILWRYRDTKLPENLRYADFVAVAPRGLVGSEGDSVRVAFVVDSTGRTLSCGPATHRDDNRLAAIACEQLPSRLKVSPAKDRSAKPTLSVQDAKVDLTAAPPHKR